jgi:hypothetical protein
MGELFRMLIDLMVTSAVGSPLSLANALIAYRAFSPSSINPNVATFGSMAGALSKVAMRMLPRFVPGLPGVEVMAIAPGDGTRPCALGSSGIRNPGAVSFVGPVKSFPNSND